MSWKNVKLIFSREVRDQLRDRRTLFMITILPLLLYPVLGLFMMQMVLVFSEKPRTVVILGAGSLPKIPELLKDGHFVSTYFKIPSDTQKLNVYTDADVREGKKTNPDAEHTVVNGDEIRGLVAREQKLIEAKTKWETKSGEDSQPFPQQAELTKTKKDLAELIEGVEIVLIIPSGFGKHVEEMNRRLASREFDEVTKLMEDRRPIIVRNSADEKSQVAYKYVSEAISSWEANILKVRLQEARLPETLAEPVRAEKVDLAEEGQLSAVVWSKLFSAMLVIMAMTGAFYPAVDLAAGEKERGTMETLLICPATRTELVLGKFFTVMLFSLATAILNLISLGITSKYVPAAGHLSKLGSMAPPTLGTIVCVIAFMLPLTALFSALCLALATFARSTKEGQYYLTPLLLVTLGLTVFCLTPGMEMTPFYSIIPVVGPALLLKETLANPGSDVALYYALPVLLSSVGYSLLALWWAIDQFSREEVLFREAERFELRLWLRHLLRDKEPTPSFAEAGICFVMIMFLQFAAMRFMQQAIVGAGPGHIAERMMQMLMVQQLAIIASPALFMGVILTTDVVRTFRIRLPSLGMLSLAFVLPFVLHPLSVELSTVLQKYFFLPLPSSIAHQVSTMVDLNQPLWLVLLAFAAAPAIGEEIAFRGFILSGFNRSKRTWLAIGLTSLMFGLMHMIPQQVFNASLLGLVLGLIAVRGGSLLPCMLFHFTWNSLAVLHGRWGQLETAPNLNDSPWHWLFSFQDSQVHYRWPLLIAMTLLGGYLIYRLAKHPSAGEEDSSSLRPPQEPAEEKAFSDPAPSRQEGKPIGSV